MTGLALPARLSLIAAILALLLAAATSPVHAQVVRFPNLQGGSETIDCAEAQGREAEICADWEAGRIEGIIQRQEPTAGTIGGRPPAAIDDPFADIDQPSDVPIDVLGAGQPTPPEAQQIEQTEPGAQPAPQLQPLPLPAPPPAAVAEPQFAQPIPRPTPDEELVALYLGAMQALDARQQFEEPQILFSALGIARQSEINTESVGLVDRSCVRRCGQPGLGLSDQFLGSGQARIGGGGTVQGGPSGQIGGAQGRTITGGQGGPGLPPEGEIDPITGQPGLSPEDEELLAAAGIGAAGDNSVLFDADPNLLAQAGDIIFATLITRALSSAPSAIIAEVISSGPLKGARLIGSFSVQYDRLLITFNRLSLPDGRFAQIEGVAIDTNTSLSTLADDVDYHTLERYALAAGAAFLAGFGEALAGTDEVIIVTDDGSVRTQATEQSLAEALADGLASGAEAITRDVEFELERLREPTVVVREGTTVGLVLLKDIVAQERD